MLRRFAVVLGLLALLTAGRPLQAADASALDAISSEASVVVRFKNPKATVEKLAGFIDLVQPGFGAQVRMQSQALGVAISNPTLAGVNMASDWYIAVFAQGEGAEPQVVFVIPATDLAAMKAALGEDVHFLEYENWGVYTGSAEAAEAVEAYLKDDDAESISESIDKASAATMEQGDLSVFVNVPQLTELYQEEIKALQEQAQAALEQAQENGVPGVDIGKLSTVLAEALAGFAQGVQDTNGFVAAIGINKQGITIEELVVVEADSPTDEYLESSKPGTLSALAALPPKQLGYLGLNVDMKNLLQFGALMMESAEFDDDSEKAAGDIKKLMEQISALEFGSMVGSFSLGSVETGALRSASVMEVSDPKKLRELSAKLYKSLGSLTTSGVKQTYDLKPDAEKVGQVSVDVLTVKQESNEEEGEANPADAIIKTIYGPEGITSRTAYLKDRVLQTTGGGKAAITALIETQTKSPAVASKGLAAARAKMPEKTNLLALIDLPGLVVTGVKVASEANMLPIPLDPAMLEGLELKESFIGFSVGTEPQAVRIRTHIPTEQVQGLARVGMLFVVLQQQQIRN